MALAGSSLQEGKEARKRFLLWLIALPGNDADGINISYSDKKDDAGIDIYSTADYIYALLERTPEEIRKSESYKGYGKYSFDEIEVYDWDGVFVANYQTDKPFYDFVVSPDNHYLYTIAEDPELLEYVITRYELPL